MQYDAAKFVSEFISLAHWPTDMYLFGKTHVIVKFVGFCLSGNKGGGREAMMELYS